jgi:signal transduction histidine kinase
MGDRGVGMDEGDRKIVCPREDTLPWQCHTQARYIIEALPIDVILYDTSLTVHHVKIQHYQPPPLGGFLDHYLDACTEKGTVPPEGWNNWLHTTFATQQPMIRESVIFLYQGHAHWIRVKSQALPPLPECPHTLGLLTLEDMGRLTRVRQRLDHQERLAALGKMTSKVAHELNSPLDGILRYLNLADRALNEHRDEKSHEYLERCREGLHRMVHIVSELLEHARLPRQHPSLAPLKTTVEDALHAISAKAGVVNVEVETHLSPDIPDLHASQLYQVLCNVFRNAFEALPEGGHLTIEAHLAASERVEITVTDSGEGIAPSDLKQVFDPFFSTKASGTGLGLAVTKEILQGCGGTITIDSQPGMGTTVSIHLPLARIT